MVGELASRLAGSPDLYGEPRRRPRRSTSSPATTASRWPTSCRYNDKHNEANGEDNSDGANDNDSWNCGVEGPTDDPAIRALRAPADEERPG